MQTSLGALSAVVDHGDGTYSALLTAGVLAGTAQITGTYEGDLLPSLAIVLVAGPADPSTSVITVSEDAIPADGISTATVTLVLKDSAGNPLSSGGDFVVLESTLGSLSDVIDNGNGTYSAVLTAGLLEGEAVLSGAVGGLDLPSKTVSIVANTFSFEGSVFRDTNGDDSLDPSDRDGQRSAFEDEISGVTVSLIGAGPDGELETDDDFTIATAITASPYSFESVPAGVYLLVVSGGTVPEHYLPTGAATQRVTVSASGVTGETDFGFAPRAITGVLTDHTGVTVPGIVVTYTAATGQVFSATTKADGSYLLGEGAEAIPSSTGELSVKIGGFTTIRPVVDLGVLSVVSLEAVEPANPDPATTSTTSLMPPTTPANAPGSLPVSGSNSRSFLVVAWLLLVAGFILDRIGRSALSP